VLLLSDSPPPGQGEGEKSAVYPPHPGHLPPGERGISGSFRSTDYTIIIDRESQFCPEVLFAFNIQIFILFTPYGLRPRSVALRIKKQNTDDPVLSRRDSRE
jgi:hypothetical protein